MRPFSASRKASSISGRSPVSRFFLSFGAGMPRHWRHQSPAEVTGQAPICSGWPWMIMGVIARHSPSSQAVHVLQVFRSGGESMRAYAIGSCPIVKPKPWHHSLTALGVAFASQAPGRSLLKEERSSFARLLPLTRSPCPVASRAYATKFPLGCLPQIWFPFLHIGLNSVSLAAIAP